MFSVEHHRDSTTLILHYEGGGPFHYNRNHSFTADDTPYKQTLN